MHDGRERERERERANNIKLIYTNNKTNKRQNKLTPW